jgi:hypothetical protein
MVDFASYLELIVNIYGYQKHFTFELQLVTSLVYSWLPARNTQIYILVKRANAPQSAPALNVALGHKLKLRLFRLGSGYLHY